MITYCHEGVGARWENVKNISDCARLILKRIKYYKPRGDSCIKYPRWYLGRVRELMPDMDKKAFWNAAIELNRKNILKFVYNYPGTGIYYLRLDSLMKAVAKFEDRTDLSKIYVIFALPEDDCIDRS